MLSSQAPGSSRDLLLLDIALESWLRMLVERQDKRVLSGEPCCNSVLEALLSVDSVVLVECCVVLKRGGDACLSGWLHALAAGCAAARLRHKHGLQSRPGVRIAIMSAILHKELEAY